MSTVSMLFILFIKGETKTICFSTSSTFPNICNSQYLFQNINETINITEEIIASIAESDYNISIVLSGDFEYQVPFHLFIDKIIYVKLYQSAKGLFDFNGIENVDIIIESFDNNDNIHILGSKLIDKQTSIKLIDLNVNSDIKNFDIKALEMTNTNIFFTHLTLNSFYYKGSEDTELTLFDDYIIVNQSQISYYGENQIFSIELTANNAVVFNNKIEKKSSISFFSFQSIKSLLFIGNDFSYSNSFYINSCESIISNISLSINSTINIQSKMIFDIINNSIQSRIYIQLGTIYSANSVLAIQSSWIDLTIQNLSFNSRYFPIYPCAGSGGSSTEYIEIIKYTGTNTNSIKYDTLHILLDVTGRQTDESLSLLRSKEWDAITFKSFPSYFLSVSQFKNLKYSPDNVFGFSKNSNIINITSTITDKYTIKFNGFSYFDIPILLYYNINSECPNDKIPIVNMSNLTDLIPSNQKIDNLTIVGSEDIDLRGLKTTDCMLTIFHVRRFNYDEIGSKYIDI